ncbi:hypothetical protein MTR66_01020 [Novosphingobium sp. 2638]|uniref:Hpr(Ser) kinase/phosphatase n=2 Tax=Novosphingobium beihaiensis TaxID=2930389 RepID=A0ABT0BK19_9SPHN|nr:hypothetical protein [Novosphingobium beihaiensis]
MTKHDSQYYRLCGFSVRSQIPLPELPVLEAGDVPSDVDLDIRFGPVPERLENADHVYPRFETSGSDLLLIKSAQIARYLLQAPGKVTIQSWEPFVERDVRSVLLASVMGGFFHMQGLFPLHASAVRFGDGVVAFSGASGAGKSTLAAFLSERGYQVITDDVCVIDLAEDAGRALVRPSFARLRLWGESMDALGKPLTEESRNTVRWNKYHLMLPSSRDVLPLKAVVLLEADASCDRPGLVPVKGGQAIAKMIQNVFRPEYARFLGRDQVSFRSSTSIAGNVPVHELRRKRDFEQMEDVVSLLENAFA